jgi:hypothetical protein
VARSRRGYHASGTEILRLSRKVTVNCSLENATSATRSSAASAKVLIPSLKKFIFVLKDNGFDPSQLVIAKADLIGQTNWREPVFSGLLIAIDVNMRRFV